MVVNENNPKIWASLTAPNPDDVTYWVDLTADPRGNIIKFYDENDEKWYNLTSPTSDYAVYPYIGPNGNWFIENRDSGVRAQGYVPDATINGKRIADNPVLTKEDIGLGNVANLAPADMPISTATATALSGKTDSTRNIVAGSGLTGGGNLTADRTINVASATDGIIVNADNIQLNTNNTLTSTSTTQALSAAQGKVLKDEADAKFVAKTQVVQTEGTSTTDVMSQKAVTDELTALETNLNSKTSKLDLEQKINAVKITPGNNLLNRNYVEPSNPYEYERGGADRLINPTTGVVVDYPSWYISPLIDWQDKTQAIIYNCRFWAQYAEDGVTLKGIYYPGTAQSGNILIDKVTDAKYIRVGLITGSGNTMMNFGNVLLPFEPYMETMSSRVYGNTQVYFNPLFKDMLLSESYIPQSPTYTDGVVNSPLSVIWADGDSGVLTLTRNSDGLVTKIVATKIRSGVTTTLTENITRDSDGNATNITIA